MTGLTTAERSLTPVRKVLDRIEVVDDETGEAELMARLVAADRPLVVSFLNQHVMNLACRSSEFAHCLIQSHVLLRDGVGMELCLSALGRSAGRNMNGTDFIPRIAAAFSGRRVALFGTAEPWTSRAAEALAAMGCRIVSALDGFRPHADYADEVEHVRPELVILAMGNPKQEEVASIIAGAATHPVVIVNGGAIADFLACRFERAPSWMRRFRCEWMFRLMLEPRRLWRRYLLGGVSFAWYVLRLRRVP
jgi:exopolysaccharide biosynthesis WecB/TagA/CpsF family protein